MEIDRGEGNFWGPIFELSVRSQSRFLDFFVRSMSHLKFLFIIGFYFVAPGRNLKCCTTQNLLSDPSPVTFIKGYSLGVC